MPATKPDGHFIPAAEFPIYKRLMADYRAGRLTNRPPNAERRRHRSGGNTWIGKPAAAISAGAQSGSAGDVNLYSLVSGTWTASGEKKTANWSTGAFATTDFVAVTDVDGDLVVSCVAGVS